MINLFEQGKIITALFWEGEGHPQEYDPLYDVIKNAQIGCELQQNTLAGLITIIPEIPLLCEMMGMDSDADQQTIWNRLYILVKSIGFESAGLRDTLTELLHDPTFQSSLAREMVWHIARVAGYEIKPAEIDAEQQMRKDYYPVWLDLKASTMSQQEAAAAYIEAVAAKRLDAGMAFDRLTVLRKRLSPDAFADCAREMSGYLPTADLPKFLAGVAVLVKLNQLQAN